MLKTLTLGVLWYLLSFISASALPRLTSLPAAAATIFFDFDGHTVSTSIWNNGNPLLCEGAGLTDAQITEIFNRVAEDYRPFDVNITTDSAVFLAAPLDKRIRIIVTTTSDWYPAVGGVAYVGSFTWGDDTPGFVFSNRLGPFNAKMVAECCSHESGHTMGLSHQSKYDVSCSLTATYNDGEGNGETGWAPIMGNSYYRNKTGWNNGPTPGGCNSLQDNLSIITTNNGFTYRKDDHSNDPDINPSRLIIENNSFSADGVITTTTDRDVFEIDLPRDGLFHLHALPFAVGPESNGADLDIKLILLDAFKQPVKIYNPASLLDVTVDTSLFSGKYYIVVDGAGTSFSSRYGSLGSYKITGTVTPSAVSPVTAISLNGTADNTRHTLYWAILQEGFFKSLELESSTDGSYFTGLLSLSATAKKFSYRPYSKGNIYYRLKATYKTGEMAHSNIISLRSDGTPLRSFTVSTFVRDEILLNAAEKGRYLISDINGKVVLRGDNAAGLSRINVANYPMGMYVLQIIGKNERISEKIIKQ